MEKKRNLWVIPTDKPSILGRFIDTNNLFLRVSNDIPRGENVNIYITSDEEIKDVRPHKGKWHLEKENILNKSPDYLTDLSECKLVIMTTDDDLINDGAQAIPDEFLEWFVNNSSCYEVEVKLLEYGFDEVPICKYEIIIPKEEPKQENLEEVAERFYPPKTTDLICSPKLVRDSFIAGAKWQKEQDKNLYSEEDLLNFGAFVRIEDKKEKRLFLIQDYYKKWLEKFKKK